MKNFLIILLFSVRLLSVYSQNPGNTGSDSKMQWFANAKLGIFLHWGIYSLGETSESWEFHNKHISYPDYMLQGKRFTASGYDPAEWVKLIRHTGARYAVITSKHHDGVALWNTRQNELSISKITPAGRDVLTPFVTELRKAGIKTGLYFSLIDWSYPDYPGFLKDSSRYDAKADPARWNRFLRFCNGQMDELLAGFNPDLWWFDGDWEHSANEWHAAEIREKILTKNPKAIINGRLQGFGDYDTPEQNFPVSRPKMPYWELCMTVNDSWGFYKKDTNYKTPYQVISIFADVISMGGNLLLDIGPKADGTIPGEQKYILTEFGNWTGKHHEAVFESLPGIPPGHFYGPTTVSLDSTSLYLFLPGKQSGEVVVKGLMSKIKKISILGNSEPVTWQVVGKISWSPVPGLVYITVPAKGNDRYMTVLKVELDAPVRLYRGKGGLSL